MAHARVSIILPYLLLIPVGKYPTSGEGGSIQLDETLASPGGEWGQEPKTIASMAFVAENETDADAFALTRHQLADRLLRRVNHLLRWYRVSTGQATILELTRARVSPFRFTLEGTGEPWGGAPPLEYEVQSPPSPIVGSRTTFGDAVRLGLNSGTDPDVAKLNLLDAEYARSVGRFRDAVLLCWGAIDSTFVRKFKKLVDDRLTDESGDVREFLKGLDFGLRYKMTAGLRLLVGRSLYAEPDGFWQELSGSYSLRNRIIHDGQIAHEHDAIRAINVARKIVEIVASLDDT